MAPMSIVAGPPPMHDQRASHFMTPEVNSPIQYPWYLNLGRLHPLAPVDVATDEYCTIPGPIFPSVDPPLTQSLNEGREVRYLSNSRATTDEYSSVSSGLPSDQHESI